VFPDSPYAGATGTFKRPVLPPGVDPTATPSKTVTFSCNWLPYIRGALQQLLLQSTWQYSSQAALDLVQAQAATLISMFDECSGGSGYACSWDFTLSPGPWTDMGSVPLWTPPSTAVWSLFYGAWVDTDHSAGSGDDVRACDIGLVLSSPIHVGAMSFAFELQKGGLALSPANVGVQMWSAGFAASLFSSYGPVTGYADGSNGFTLVQDVANVSIIRVLVTADYQHSIGALSGFARVPQIFLAGPGPAPC